MDSQASRYSQDCPGETALYGWPGAHFETRLPDLGYPHHQQGPSITSVYLSSSVPWGCAHAYLEVIVRIERGYTKYIEPYLTHGT